MNAPFVSTFSMPVFILVSLILGFFFGFFLERAGFSSALKLTSQFYFRDFSVLKVMFTAIVVAMVGIGYFAMLGWLDMSQVFVPPAFIWPQLVGGLLLGAGFIVGGYCPGTSLVAAAIGKLDALFFIGGIFIGSRLSSVSIHPVRSGRSRFRFGSMSTRESSYWRLSSWRSARSGRRR
jgi:hypothetical protein